jgi:16S rRNA (cytidine1402-2'-O)-methyltransferase
MTSRSLSPATLYVVATPIGNLADVTLRALEVLGSADIIFAEDTRHTRRFMTHHGLSVRLVSAHKHNEAIRARELVRRLGAGESVALVTDAGSPGLSDPGARLVAAAAEAGFTTLPIPGPSALVAALSVSGVSADRFSFAGFLPARPPARKKALLEYCQRDEAIAFFEAPHRIRTTLAILQEIIPEREIAACRELTKRFEEVIRGTPAEVAKRLSSEKERGEWTVILAPESDSGGKKKRKKSQEMSNKQKKMEKDLTVQGVSPEEAAEKAAFIYGGGPKHRKPKRRS